MLAIRQDEKSKKKLNLVVIHFPFFSSWKLLLKWFFFCNLNVKLPDVRLMLEELKLCII